ncbi:hypothetical protein Pcinc_034013 [Petrolisthes cinctipes]|uniref:Uncharacterized protein n=1 Tax=Petrolisthes cinctipes TaxID=88211 RepID=A0AAE1ER48_PETCI|nr:hypothetical protein Pcinc_034013 [Petrolisthes cinctipes]
MPKNFNKERLNFRLTNSHNTQFTQNSKAEGHHTRIEKICTCQPLHEKMKNDQTCIGFSTNSGDISDLNNMQSANVHSVEKSPSKAHSLHSMTNKGYVNQGVSSTINERGIQSIQARPNRSCSCFTIKSTAAKYYHDDQTPPPYCTGYSTSESLGLAHEWNCKCYDYLSDKEKRHNSRSFFIHENDDVCRPHRPQKYRSWSRSRGSHSFYQREWSRTTESPPYPSYTRKSRSRKSVPTMSNVRKSNSRGSITNRSRSHESISNRSSPHMSPSSRSTSRESTNESWSDSDSSDSSWSGSFESTQSKFTSCTPLPSGSETQRSRKSYYPGRWRSRLNRPRSWGSQSTASDYNGGNRGRERVFNRKWELQAQHSQLANKSSRGSRDRSKITNQLCTAMGTYRKIMYNNRTAAQNWRKGKGYKNGRTFSHKGKNNEGYGRCHCNEIVSCNDFQPLTEDLRRRASGVDNIQDFLKEVKYLSTKTSKPNAGKMIHHSDQEGNNKVPRTDTVNYDYVEGFSDSEECVFGKKTLLFSSQKNNGKLYKKPKTQTASISDAGKSISQQDHYDSIQVPETRSVKSIFVEGGNGNTNTICSPFLEEEHLVSTSGEPANDKNEMSSGATEENKSVTVSISQQDCMHDISTDRSEIETLRVERKSDVFLPDIEDFTFSSCLNSNHLQDTIEKKRSIPKESHTSTCPNIPSEPDRVRLAEDTICSLEDDVNYLSNDITTPANMSISLDVHQPTNVIGSKEDKINSCGLRESACDVTYTTEGQSSDCLTRDCIMKSATTIPAKEYNSIEERFAILNNKEVETILTLISFTESPDDSQEKATTNLFHSSCTESTEEDDDCESNSSFPLFELDSCDIFTDNETNECEVIKGNNDRGMLTTQGANTIKEPLSKINISDELKLTEEQLLTKKVLAIRECSVVLKDVKEMLNTRQFPIYMTEHQNFPCNKIPKRKPSVNRRTDRDK